jgi:hemoglobin/transferrin/lactoferrin receptor protein
MRIILSWFLVFGLIHIGHGQTATILSKEGKIPLESVLLHSENPNIQGITNKNGQVDLSPFMSVEKIDIRYLGYKPIIESYLSIKEKGFIIYLEEAGITLDEMVISASRWQESSKGIPSKIRTISTSDVQLLQPQTAADLLGISGEVSIQKSQQGGGSPMIRGFATNRLLYVIDGVRMNTSIFRAGNLQNVISLDPFTIENTEVIFGPGSVIYGSDAIGGVMNFQTIKPRLSVDKKWDIHANISSRYSSANKEETTHGTLHIGTKQLASVTSYSFNQFGDLKMGKYGPDSYLRPFYVDQVENMDKIIQNANPRIQVPSGYDQQNVMQKFLYKPSERWEIQYGFHRSATTSYPRYDRLIEVNTAGMPVSAVWNYGPQIWQMNHFSVQHFGDNLLYDALTFRMAHQYFEESRIDRNFSGSNRYRLRTQVEKVNALSINIDLKKTLKKGILYYGLESVGNKVSSQATAKNIQTEAPILVADRYPQARWNSYAIFGNYQYPVSKKYTAQLGIRYNLFNMEADFSRNLAFFPFAFKTTNIQNGAFSGNAGLVISPDDKTKISLNAATGFRAPNVDDMGKLFDFVSGEVVVPNIDLTAEIAYNGEINLSKLIGNSLKIDLTGYYTYLQNAMVRRATKVDGKDSILYNGKMSKTYSIQNAAFAEIYGFHAGFEIDLPLGFYLSSRYNVQIGKEELNNGATTNSRHAAPAFGLSTLGYKKGKIHLQFYAAYSASVSYENLNEEERQKPAIYARDENGKPYSPSWYTLNMKGMFTVFKSSTLNIGFENLTNQRYRTYSSGIVAPGINAIVGLSVLI